jgi:hypothetical protein
MIALALACSLLTQNCPSDQYCTHDFDPAHPQCADSGECRPLPASPDLELWLPIPAGEAIYCAKGNLAHPGSHDACYDNSRFALDLGTPAAEAPHVILAAADGVAYFWDGCSSANINQSNDRCNNGWGNYVHVEHQKGVYTHYAHLSAILVGWGETVKRGQPIGIEGNTGAAGGKHVHFSLHVGDATVGVGASVPIKKLRVQGAVVSGRALRCGDWTKTNDVLAETRLVSATTRLPGPPGFAFAPRSALPKMAVGDPASRKRAVEALRKLSDPESRYWLAAALQLDGAWDECRRTLEPLADLKAPRWIAQWSRLRLAEVFLAQARTDEARRALAKLDGSGENDEFRQRLNALRAKLGL